MYTFLSVIYVLVCLFLILVVLLQPGRGGVGGAFGGGSSQTVFGSSGAGNFLTRLTSISAALFMLLSATLAFMSSSSDKSLERATEAARAKSAAKAKLVSDAGAASETAGDAGVVSPLNEEPGSLGAPAEGANAAPVEAVPPAEASPDEKAPAAAPTEGKPAAPTLERIVPPAEEKKPATK
ncbi:MAG: preprotein translocase subunit SecG [Polyangiales bacterium]